MGYSSHIMILNHMCLLICTVFSGDQCGPSLFGFVVFDMSLNIW